MHRLPPVSARKSPPRVAARPAPGARDPRRLGASTAAPAAPPRAAARGADPHRALAEHERPQPRRRLRAPARALPLLGGGARRAGRGDRGGDPAGRHLEGQVGADPGDPARDPATRRTWLARATLPVDEARDVPHARCRASAARPRPACCCSPSACRDVPVDTHVARVGPRLGLLRPGAPFEELHDQMLRHDAARRASSSCTSTCCATAAGPATRSARPARSARCGACARAGCADRPSTRGSAILRLDFIPSA